MKKLQRPDNKLTGSRAARLERPQKPPRGTQWPKFNTLFEPTINPLAGLDPGDDPQDVAEQVMERVEGVFMQDEGRKLDEYRTMVSGDFYLVVVFQSPEQKYEWLAMQGAEAQDGVYIDGLKLAKAQGLDIVPIPLPTKEPKRIPRVLRDIQTIPKGGDINAG